jgi:hypothetical protein
VAQPTLAARGWDTSWEDLWEHGISKEDLRAIQREHPLFQAWRSPADLLRYARYALDHGETLRGLRLLEELEKWMELGYRKTKHRQAPELPPLQLPEDWEARQRWLRLTPAQKEVLAIIAKQPQPQADIPNQVAQMVSKLYYLDYIEKKRAYGPINQGQNGVYGLCWFVTPGGRAILRQDPFYVGSECLWLKHCWRRTPEHAYASASGRIRPLSCSTVSAYYDGLGELVEPVQEDPVMCIECDGAPVDPYLEQFCSPSCKKGYWATVRGA